MIFGIGTDIIDVDRIAIELNRDDGFREKTFTNREIQYCESKKQKALNYAARFAAKEAFFKAIGTGWRGGLAFIEVEVVNDAMGKPSINLHGASKDFMRQHGIAQAHVTLSHIRDFASAVVILERDGG